jgi:zinc protease
LNSLLGGGYSSRLNQEIRIKRGLSYGAGSSFGWRWDSSTFSTRTQTKNESAAEVVELVLAEIERLAEDESISAAELDPRKSVLTGGFGRRIETTGGLVNALADLYTFDIPPAELNRYMTNVNSVTDKQIRGFAKSNLLGGDVIIVGDYSIFRDDLAKRFPNIKPVVIPASELDITKPGLRK